MNKEIDNFMNQAKVYLH